MKGLPGAQGPQGVSLALPRGHHRGGDVHAAGLGELARDQAERAQCPQVGPEPGRCVRDREKRVPRFAAFRQQQEVRVGRCCGTYLCMYGLPRAKNRIL